MSVLVRRFALVALAPILLLGGLVLASGTSSAKRPQEGDLIAEVLNGASLDGSGNNIEHPLQGKSNTPYPRVAAANYADGVGAPLVGPASPRYISNRIYNDTNQNIFSENGVSHWGVIWGQFLDHTFGNRLDGTENASLAYDAKDPLESFRNNLGMIPFARSGIAAGTGVTTPRQQVNTVSSYIDAWAVYGGTNERLDWLRPGPIDGDPTNNDAHLLLTRDGYLPTSAARPGVTAPAMDLFVDQMAHPETAVVAGDARANENIGLTAVHTLFAREHNRIVDALPPQLPEEVKFQVARRIVTAEEQWITYNEFLPSMGVKLSKYRGYDATVDASITDEFATVGYRAHSQIHGEFEADLPPDSKSAPELATLESQGVEVTVADDGIGLVIPLNVAFGRPALVSAIGLGNLAVGLASESDYANDALIDNQLRSVLFQAPLADPDDCLDGPTLPQCFSGVVDLGAIDLARGYDHGMPLYNDMRAAYGLRPIRSFTQITGEDTDRLQAGLTIDDPAILDFVSLKGREGEQIVAGTDAAENDVIEAKRTTTTAARLKAIYGSVDKLDAFTGMMAERHVPGTEFGELQLAMWTKQFESLRDGDRYFYGNDPALEQIARRFGIDYRHSLAQIIVANTGVAARDVPKNVFLLDGDHKVRRRDHKFVTVDHSKSGGHLAKTTTTAQPTTTTNPTTTANVSAVTRAPSTTTVTTTATGQATTTVPSTTAGAAATTTTTTTTRAATTSSVTTAAPTTTRSTSTTASPATTRPG